MDPSYMQQWVAMFSPLFFLFDKQWTPAPQAQKISGVVPLCLLGSTSSSWRWSASTLASRCRARRLKREHPRRHRRGRNGTGSGSRQTAAVVELKRRAQRVFGERQWISSGNSSRTTQRQVCFVSK